MDTRAIAKDVSHIVILVILIGIVVFLLTWTGVMHCKTIPGWCGTYYFLKGGEPRVLILSGDGGMGNPDLLERTFRDPSHIGILAIQGKIDRTTLGNLQEFDLVIVEHARKIETSKLRMFIEYVNGGGRLVWTGDAGVEAGERDEFLYTDEDPDLDTNEHNLVNPWARKDGKDIVDFTQFLGVSYQTNYCSIKLCDGRPWQGLLVTSPGANHPLAYALKPNLVLRGDFAIVKDESNSITKRVLTLDWFSNLVGENQVNYGRTFPLIVTSGYGERVAYYAVPPDQFVEDDLPEKYYSLVENIYYGMLR